MVVTLKTPTCTLADFLLENEPEWITRDELIKTYNTDTFGNGREYNIAFVQFDDSTKGAIVYKNDGTVPFDSDTDFSNIPLDDPDLYFIDKIFDKEHKEINVDMSECDIEFAPNGLDWEGRFDGELITHRFALDGSNGWATVVKIYRLDEE